MLHQLRSLAFILLIVNANFLFAQNPISCGEPDSTPIPTVSENCFLQDGSNASELAVLNWDDPGIFDKTLIVVTSPESEGVTQEEVVIGEFIIGISPDGTFDFSDNGEGSAFDTGIYKFTPFSFNQGELNELAVGLNPLLLVLGYPEIPIGDDGTVALIDVLATIGAVFGDIQISDVEFAICDFLPGLGFGLSYGVGEAYERVVVTSLDECPAIGLNEPSAIEFGISNISPVPAYNNLSIDFISTNDVVIQLSDIAGKVITESNAVSGTTNSNFDVSNYPSGIYFARISDGRNVAKQKFIVN